ncbi:MAG: ABC transporter permease [Dehalococcoidia bacterium]
MSSYTRRRLLLCVPTLIGSTMLVFFLVRILPGDVADVLTTEGHDPTAAAQLREEFGLDKPIPVQYVDWVGSVLRGDFGTSIWTQRSVTTQLKETLPVTIELTILAMLFSIIVGFAVGGVSAIYQDRPTDYVLRTGSMLGISIPYFWFATLLLVLPGIWWGYSPPLLYHQIWEDPARNLQQMAFPALALGLPLSAITARMVRSAVLEVRREDYVRTAAAKGLSGNAVMRVHVLPNSLIPVVTLLGSQAGFLLGGAVIIESIFTLPGLGASVLSAITRRDYPQFQADVFCFAAMLILVNLVVDLAYTRIDPRIRLQ